MRKTIHADEILLTVDTHENSPFFNESATKAKQERDLKAAIKGLPDSVIQVLLFDLEEMWAEDVTEDAALLWLEDYNGTPDDEDQPEYVKESEAFNSWCESYRIENGSAEKRGQYSTLNKLAQGTVS